ncbi:MAG: HIRAN protein [Hydrogenophilales bacterium CG_4_9_14_3_um_filter_63_34]|nr:MAG: HIRAN protein [Hydrogenophilales bacterium CG_4_10_14_3_um_filter_63_21]PJB04891.1 MAG: HIRAN protein [Hydrogenophilales bacterium CG_4_9_14_3_um_filter_63_34]
MNLPGVLRGALAALLLTGTVAHAAEVEQREILQVSPLAGFQHYAGAALFPLMNVGERLTLRREPDNPYDPKAVRVEWYGTQIGYAPRADNVDLARLMDRGTPVEARILHLQKARDPWKRVLIEIYLAPTP